MGGRGSGGGRSGGGGGAAKKVPTGEGITDKQELINLYNSISGNSSYTIDERVRAMKSIENRINELSANDLTSENPKEKYRTKADKIRYMNVVSGTNLNVDTSYTSKEIDYMFRQVLKGKKIKKLGYGYVVDYGND